MTSYVLVGTNILLCVRLSLCVSWREADADYVINHIEYWFCYSTKKGAPNEGDTWCSSPHWHAVICSIIRISSCMWSATLRLTGGPVNFVPPLTECLLYRLLLLRLSEQACRGTCWMVWAYSEGICYFSCCSAAAWMLWLHSNMHNTICVFLCVCLLWLCLFACAKVSLIVYTVQYVCVCVCACFVHVSLHNCVSLHSWLYFKSALWTYMYNNWTCTIQLFKKLTQFLQYLYAFEHSFYHSTVFCSFICVYYLVCLCLFDVLVCFSPCLCVLLFIYWHVVVFMIVETWTCLLEWWLFLFVLLLCWQQESSASIILLLPHTLLHSLQSSPQYHHCGLSLFSSSLHTLATACCPWLIGQHPQKRFTQLASLL